MLKIAVLVCVCVGLMHGYPGFLKEIPNGEAVPNPCTEDPEDKWNLVGHMYASRIEFMRARRQNPDRYVNVFGEVRHFIFCILFLIKFQNYEVTNILFEIKLNFIVIFRYYTVYILLPLVLVLYSMLNFNLKIHNYGNFENK